jgi:hypothetical protein
MEITVVTGFSAKWDMNINTCHQNYFSAKLQSISDRDAKNTGI